MFSDDRPEPVIILAGGRGTRLGELTDATPKPMLPVEGRPFLEYLLLQLGRYGFRRFIIATGYLGDQVKATIGAGQALGLDVRYSEEDEPLGTAGALRRAILVARADRCLVLNGDTFLDADPGPVVDAVDGDVVVALAVTREVKDDRYGRVRVAESGEVEAFVPAGRETAGLVSAGVYCVSRHIVDRIPAAGPASLEHDVLPALVADRRVVAVERTGYFVDIGIPTAYDGLRAAPAPLLAAAGLRH